MVTPGTLQEDDLLQPHQHNFRAAIGRVSAELAMSWADMSTGDFFVQACDKADIDTVLARLQAAEVIYADDLSDQLRFVQSNLSENYNLSAEPSAFFDHKKAMDRLAEFYGVSTLQGFGQFTPPMLSAAGGLLAYLQRTQLQQMPRLSPPTILLKQAFMDIDAATRKSLELTHTLSGERVAACFTRLISPTRLLAHGCCTAAFLRL